MQKTYDRFCEHTTYSGTTYSGSITKGDTMRVRHNKGYNAGITITNNGEKLTLNNVDEITKLLEKIEVACWGSSSYTDL